MNLLNNDPCLFGLSIFYYLFNNFLIYQKKKNFIDLFGMIWMDETIEPIPLTLFAKNLWIL